MNLNFALDDRGEEKTAAMEQVMTEFLKQVSSKVLVGGVAIRES